MSSVGMLIKAPLVNLLYRLSPGLRKVAEDRATFAAELDSVRAERDILNQRIRTETTKKAEFIAQFADSVIRASLLASGSRDHLRRSAASWRGHAKPDRSSRAAKFVVFSNPRSGSTWLQTLLRLLPDVYVEYELKWGVTYKSGVHAILDESSPTISQLLEDMDIDVPVTGSKFVFDVRGLAPADFLKLAAKIGPDVRIIHLTRNYRDVFLSIRRGYHHAPMRTQKLGQHLRNALEDADIRHAQQVAAQPVPLLTCCNELSDLLANDIHVHSLRAAGFPYLQVDYDAVDARLAEIAEFAGSKATHEQIADALARPAVAKLPAFDGNDLVANLEELQPLFESFESLRRHFVATSGS